MSISMVSVVQLFFKDFFLAYNVYFGLELEAWCLPLVWGVLAILAKFLYV